MGLDLANGLPLQGITFLNIPYTHGGSNLWGEHLAVTRRSRKKGREKDISTSSFNSVDLSVAVQGKNNYYEGFLDTADFVFRSNSQYFPRLLKVQVNRQSKHIYRVSRSAPIRIFSRRSPSTKCLRKFLENSSICPSQSNFAGVINQDLLCNEQLLRQSGFGEINF